MGPYNFLLGISNLKFDRISPNEFTEKSVAPTWRGLSSNFIGWSSEWCMLLIASRYPLNSPCSIMFNNFLPKFNLNRSRYRTRYSCTRFVFFKSTAPQFCFRLTLIRVKLFAIKIWPAGGNKQLQRTGRYLVASDVDHFEPKGLRKLLMALTFWALNRNLPGFLHGIG